MVVSVREKQSTGDRVSALVLGLTAARFGAVVLIRFAITVVFSLHLSPDDRVFVHSELCRWLLRMENEYIGADTAASSCWVCKLHLTAVPFIRINYGLHQ